MIINRKKELKKVFKNDNLDIIEKEIDTKNSIIGNLGIKSFNRTVTSYSVRGKIIENFVIKSPSKITVLKGRLLCNPTCNIKMWKLLKRFNYIYGFTNSHKRECLMYEYIKNKNLDFAIRAKKVCANEKKNKYFVVLEELNFKNSICLNSFNKEKISIENIEVIVKELARVHSIFYGNFDELLKKVPLSIADNNFYKGTEEFLKATTEKNLKRYGHLIKHVDKYYEYIDNLEKILIELKKHKMTFSHNDCSLRNLAVRKESLKIVLYDFEASCIQHGEHDLIEFLIFLLPHRLKKNEYEYFIYLYKRELEKYINVEIDDEIFLKSIKNSIMNIAVNRMNLYLLANWILKFEFLEDVFRNLNDLIEIYIREGEWNYGNDN